MERKCAKIEKSSEQRGKKWEEKVEVQSQMWNVKKGGCERITWLNTIKHGLVLSQLIGCLAGNKKKMLPYQAIYDHDLKKWKK